MNTNSVLSQAVDYQKTLIDNSFALFTSMQDHGQQWVDRVLENNTLVPEGSRELYAQWVDYIKQNNEICKGYMDTSLEKVKDMFAEEKTQSSPSKASKAKTGKKSE